MFYPSYNPIFPCWMSNDSSVTNSGLLAEDKIVLLKYSIIIKEKEAETYYAYNFYLAAQTK